MDEQYNNQDFNSYSPWDDPVPAKKPMWAAVTSFVLSLVNIVCCCCMTYILTPLSLVFGILSLAKKWAGKGLAIAGVVISSVVLIFTIASNIIFGEAAEDMTKFATNADSYIQEYNESGEIPEYFQKYNDPEYDKWWHSMGYDDFEGFFRDFISGYLQSSGNSYNYNDNDNDNGNRRNNGERHVDI